MGILIDSSLWIDFFRRKSSAALRAQTSQWIASPDAVNCEPVTFEILRHATASERPGLVARLNTLPLLPTPKAVWSEAALLGQGCRDRGFTVNSLDLLIAAIALHHDAELVTFDGDYTLIAHASPRLRVNVLARSA